MGRVLLPSMLHTKWHVTGARRVRKVRIGHVCVVVHRRQHGDVMCNIIFLLTLLYILDCITCIGHIFWTRYPTLASRSERYLSSRPVKVGPFPTHSTPDLSIDIMQLCEK